MLFIEIFLFLRFHVIIQSPEMLLYSIPIFEVLAICIVHFCILRVIIATVRTFSVCDIILTRYSPGKYLSALAKTVCFCRHF